MVKKSIMKNGEKFIKMGKIIGQKQSIPRKEQIRKNCKNQGKQKNKMMKKSTKEKSGQNRRKRGENATIKKKIWQ